MENLSNTGQRLKSNITHYGILVKRPSKTPFDTIYRFDVYLRETYNIATPEDQKRNYNYQVFGKDHEAIVLRLYKNDSGSFHKAYYYYYFGIDQELALYITLELLSRIKASHKFESNFKLKALAI